MNEPTVESGFPKGATDADFEEVREKPAPAATVPATLETFSLFRHDLMAGKSNTAIEAISQELEVDKELGLKKQLELTATEALRNDIDELTSSKDYFEVSQELLKKLFQLKKLERMCFLNNFTAPIKAFFKAGTLPLFLHSVMLLSLYPMSVFSAWVWPLSVKHPTPLTITGDVFNILLWIGVGVLLVAGFICWNDRTILYYRMLVAIKSTPLRDVSEKIPYGAKLKVLEAQKTRIFEGFAYISPKFSYEQTRHTIKLPELPELDPAILGTTKDGRMYMIVYWDIEKDIAKVVKEIEHFKKFKLNKNTPVRR
jgi:hypothetical protein